MHKSATDDTPEVPTTPSSAAEVLIGSLVSPQGDHQLGQHDIRDITVSYLRYLFPTLPSDNAAALAEDVFRTLCDARRQTAPPLEQGFTPQLATTVSGTMFV